MLRAFVHLAGRHSLMKNKITYLQHAGVVGRVCGIPEGAQHDGEQPQGLTPLMPLPLHVQYMAERVGVAQAGVQEGPCPPTAPAPHRLQPTQALNHVGVGLSLALWRLMWGMG